jgi:hypothetical protein
LNLKQGLKLNTHLPEIGRCPKYKGDASAQSPLIKGNRLNLGTVKKKPKRQNIQSSNSPARLKHHAMNR